MIAKGKKNTTPNKGGATIGNQRGVGHGRPPNPGYSDEEVIALGEELMKWLKYVDDNNVEIVHLSEWYSEIKEIPYSQFESIKTRPCFFGYWERAATWMSKKIMKNKNLSTVYGTRFLGIYSKEIREHERTISREQVDYEFDKKQQSLISNQEPPNQTTIEKDNLIMELKAKLAAQLESNIDNKPKTE